MNTDSSQIEAKQTPVLCITIVCTDVRWWACGWTCAVPKVRESAASPEPIEAAEKTPTDKNAYLIEPNFSKFLDPPENWPEIGEMSTDELCPGCVAALRQQNGQVGKQAVKFVGSDDLYCLGFCEQAVN